MSRQKSRRFAVIDYEAKNWNEILGLGFFDGLRYIFFDNTEQFLDFISSPDESWIIYAHNGGKYDFLFVLDGLFPLAKKPRALPTDVICIGSSLVSFQVYNCEFRDSLKILPGSMAKILPHFGFKKMDMDYDDIENQDWKTYLENDCVTLYGTLIQYFEYLYKKFSIFPSLTIASTAMAVYRKSFDRIKEWKKSEKSATDLFARSCYQGGRCEIFKFRGDSVACYDINSMYPYVMRKHPYPVGKPTILKKQNFDSAISSGFLGLIHADIICPDIHIPLLPIRHAGKMLFFRGEISGYWTLYELRKALKIGYKITKIHAMTIWKKSKYIFRDWVDYTYRIRKESRSEAEKYILKKLLNTLYGKFAQKIEQEEVLFIGGDSAENPADFILPHIPAYVTSYARVLLYGYLNQDTYYCDTDSIFTKEIIKTSNELGGMKIEEEKGNAEFFYPKIYRTTHKTKAKGFELKRQGNISDAFQRIIDKEQIKTEKILTFKQCLSRHKRFGSKKMLTKQLRGRYDKRMSNGNDTHPYTLQEWSNKWD
jgi:hypothetical protein